MALSTIPTRALSEQGINFRNLIINGDMSIAQRGTSASNIGNSGTGYYSVDRFFWGENGDDATIRQSFNQTSDVPTGQGFSKSLKVTTTTASGSPVSNDYHRLGHHIEAQNLQHLKFGTSNAESLILSFWVKCSKTGTGVILPYQEDSNQVVGGLNYTINSADTWEKKTISIPANTSNAIANDNGSGLRIDFCFNAGSLFTGGSPTGNWETFSNSIRAVGQTFTINDTLNAYLAITGVQLEVGTSASDFEFLPYDVNLRRCQRYHFRHNPTKDAHVGVLMGFANGGSDINSCTVPVPVPMRANPSLSTDPASGSIAVRYYTPQQGTGTISSYTTLASQGDCASDGSGYLALTLNGFGGNLYATAPNGIEFESTCLILDSEL